MRIPLQSHCLVKVFPNVPIGHRYHTVSFTSQRTKNHIKVFRDTLRLGEFLNHLRSSFSENLQVSCIIGRQFTDYYAHTLDKKNKIHFSINSLTCSSDEKVNCLSIPNSMSVET